jgi:hypothetical protein
MDTTELRATMLQAILAQGIGLDQAIRDAEAAVAYVLSGPKQEAPTSLPKRGPARTNMILDMWAAGSTAKQIGALLGTSQSAIYQILQRERKNGNQRASSKGNYSAEVRAAASERVRALNTARRTA